MDKENNKRGREDMNDESSAENSSKKQDIDDRDYGSYFNLNDEEDDKAKWVELESEVFDFPWLKEGMISKLEEWNFQDAFSSSLIHDTCSSQISDDYISGLCDETTPPPTPLFDGEDCLHLELDGADCIWSSLLDLPIPNHH